MIGQKNGIKGVYRKAQAAVLCSAVLFISYLHYSSVSVVQSLHDIYRALYYLPVMLAALLFGLKGAALMYLLVLLTYLPFVVSSWTGKPIVEADRLLHLSLQGVLAILAGYMIDRDRRNREKIEKERYLSGIGRAATAVVHDLKNPLITIEGFARRLREGKGNVESSAEAILDSAERMQRIVHDVLDFARPLKIEQKKGDISSAVGRACDACDAKADKAAVTIRREFPDTPVYGSIDSFHLERAITNIISNAIEASAAGQPVTSSVLQEGRTAVIKVTDRGTGMDREALEHVFTPFHTTKASGTGLGMPISKKIVEAHLGSIRIESIVGRGTEVTIRIPLQET